jgi:hypothetical protein
MLKMVFEIDRRHKMTIALQKGASCEELDQRICKKVEDGDCFG